MIAFDANMLSLALCSNISVAVDPMTKKEIDRPKERVDLLLSDLDERGEQILIPMPALAEFLVLTGSASAQYLDTIHHLPRFVIGEFKERAAIEVAQAIRKALDLRSPALTPEQNASKKRDEVEATWAKVNFDRQIVAIAKVYPCSAIYSTDGHVAKHAEKMNLQCLHLADLPLPTPPPVEPQMELELIAPVQSPYFLPGGDPNGPSVLIEGEKVDEQNESRAGVNAVADGNAVAAEAAAALEPAASLPIVAGSETPADSMPAGEVKSDSVKL